jgi:amino acid adenylation domain-containing protein
LHELVEAQVDRVPSRAAVACRGETLTYGELESRANRLARRLRRLGAAPESIVGVFLERGVHLVTAHLGILKSGAAFLPLDPEFPTERLLYMIEDSGADILVSSSALAARLIQDVEVQLLDIHAPDLSTESDERMLRAGGPDHLAYVLYTSGSTGRPKGVSVHHEAVVNFLTSMQRSPGVEERDVFGAPTTTSFDISNLEIFLPLSVGARVVLLAGDEVRDARILHEALKSRGITVMQATPSLWTMLLDAGKPSGVRALCGGEALPPSLAKALLQTCPALYNLYGPTETTIWSTVEKPSHDDPAVLLGRPIANTTLYVLDEQLQRVPPGVYGEIYIGGAGVARGYLRRPELTAQSFVPDAFAGVAGSRLYRTGDLGRFRSDGRLEFLGRRDAQVKIRGYRIELGEIEAVLSSHQAVREAAVVVVDSHAGPVGFVTPAQPKRLGPAELRQFVRQQLPSYMVPVRIDILERMPRTANNKIDRKALAAMAVVSSRVIGTPPRNETERQIATVFEQVLQRDGITIEEDFFALGGHSLMATQVTARLGDAFGFPIPIRAIFEAPTIAHLAEWIAVARTKESGRTGGALFGPIPRSTRRKISVSGLEEVSPSTSSGSEKVRGR